MEAGQRPPFVPVATALTPEELVTCATEHVSFLLTVQSPSGVDQLTGTVEELAADSSSEGRRKAFRLWKRLRRLSRFCPDEAVRDVCARHCTLLHPPEQSSASSSFDSAEEHEKPQIDFGAHSWQQFFEQKSGNLTTLHWALAAHDGYLDRFFETKRALLFDEGPLPKPWRHFLAVLGAAQMRCEYLARHCVEMFLMAGGDRGWLIDPGNCVPRKLLRIAKLNELMCHQPWLVDERFMQDLLEPEMQQDQDDSTPRGQRCIRWSIPELLSALCILSTFHSLAAFVFALGLELEDPVDGNDWWVEDKLASFARMFHNVSAGDREGVGLGLAAGGTGTGTGSAFAGGAGAGTAESSSSSGGNKLDLPLGTSGDQAIGTAEPGSALSSASSSGGQQGLKSSGLGGWAERDNTAKVLENLQKEDQGQGEPPATPKAGSTTPQGSAAGTASSAMTAAFTAASDAGTASTITGPHARTLSFATVRSEEWMEDVESGSQASGSASNQNDEARKEFLSRLPCCFKKNLSESQNWYYFISKQEEQEMLNPIKSEKDWRALGKLTDNSLNEDEKLALQHVMAAKPLVRTPFCDFLQRFLQEHKFSALSPNTEGCLVRTSSQEPGQGSYYSSVVVERSPSSGASGGPGPETGDAGEFHLPHMMWPAVGGGVAASAAARSSVPAPSSVSDPNSPQYLKYIDFGAGAASSASEFSWADDAFPLLAQFCPEIADAIHEEYSYAQAYTNSRVGGVTVSTTMPTRRALFAYVFRVYGLEIDDFNYTRLNFYLTLMHKVFLKKLCCFPDTLTREDYERVKTFGGYSLHDMIQYIHIATQIRRVMQLQYVMAAFQRYQSRRNASEHE